MSRTPCIALAAILLAAACSPAEAPVDQPAEGTRSFDRQLALEDSGYTSANVSVGDVDVDGHADIVLVKGRYWPLADLVLLGRGDGSYAPRTMSDRHRIVRTRVR